MIWKTFTYDKINDVFVASRPVAVVFIWPKILIETYNDRFG